MAKKTTNDAKRVQMGNIMATVLGEKGWNATDLAAVMGVTSSCISAWKGGKSMGTNGQRAALNMLPSRDSQDAREMMEEVVASAKRAVASEQADLDKTTNAFDTFLAEAISHNAWEIDYHTKAIAEAHSKAELAREAAAARQNASTHKNNDLRNWEKEYLIGYISEKRYDNNTKTGYEHDVAYHTESLAEYQAHTDASLRVLATAQHKARIEWDAKALAKAEKHLKAMQKILAKW